MKSLSLIFCIYICRVFHKSCYIFKGNKIMHHNDLGERFMSQIKEKRIKFFCNMIYKKFMASWRPLWRHQIVNVFPRRRLLEKASGYSQLYFEGKLAKAMLLSLLLKQKADFVCRKVILYCKSGILDCI